MSRTRILSLIAIVAFVTTGAWLSQRYLTDGLAMEVIFPPSPRISSAEAGLPVVEKAAFDSCMCEREGGSEQECDAIYAEARRDLLIRIYGTADVDRPAEAATACAPVSSGTECFEFTDGVKCIDTGFYVNGATGDFHTTNVCTLDEARAIERAYEQGWLGPDGKEPDPDNEVEWSAANQRANDAINDMLRRILDGEEFAASHQPTGGCTV